MRYKGKRVKRTNNSRKVLFIIGMVVAVCLCTFLAKAYCPAMTNEQDTFEEVTSYTNWKTEISSEYNEVDFFEGTETLEPENEDEKADEQQEYVEEPQLSAYGPSEAYYYIVTEEEAKALEKLVYVESRGEPFEGKVAVAAVVLNRYTSEWSGFDTSSILSVITQKYQFADISEVTQSQLDEVPSCREAVDVALKGWDPTRLKFENGALYFYAPKHVEGYQKEIREGIQVMVIGEHHFHRDFEKLS